MNGFSEWSRRYCESTRPSNTTDKQVGRTLYHSESPQIWKSKVSGNIDFIKFKYILTNVLVFENQFLQGGKK